MRVMVVRCPDWDETEPFEPVVVAVEAHAAGVEILRPGLLAFAAGGPAAYHGGEQAVAERVIDEVAESCGVECGVGVADSLFAAYLAAHRGTVVPEGGTSDYLRDLDVSALGRPELTSVLRRLGIHTLGAFAALPAASVADRFGADAAFARRLAAGEDPRPPVPRTAPPDLTVTVDCDPPLERVDVAAFTARALAVQSHRLLAAHGLACSRLLVSATTGGGAEVSRVWRHDGALTADGVADRVRWQLDGWLTGGLTDGTGIVRLSLAPDGLLPQGEAQPGLWGGDGSAEARAARALVRVQGLLGAEGVVTAVPDGGRAAAERFTLVPWGEPREPGARHGRPWPGALPGPGPTLWSEPPAPVSVRDAAGDPVEVTGRYLVSAPPATVQWGRNPPVGVAEWAGPWPVSERWWRDDARRYARIQVRLVDDRAVLLFVENGRWYLEGSYD
ncbi:protein ImuB [Stackebrandtia albiflava]|uniref:Protein ImuB n=1 Tax=Stackebrandtia albiflava TaxID=406432 RepID=A0A562VBA4_9ACTN|nr:DNA polymerase Y family protein [Stackebrandtia albiflava]TWJ15087.1 protein ImuB [Stackebrandtia albiflava]